ncbi:MAG TPA: hypothetical protein VGS05_10985 [Candidatus Sulfotelmatobacter sp.]|nr:hypothetical protein [Candidatus Sulfotelmatobacter sp.]
MLIFESLSAGVMAIFFGFIAMMGLVGIYVIVIWPLTLWDLGGIHPEQFNLWAQYVLWAVFAVGTLIGYLCFSGEAFKAKRSPGAPPATIRARPTPR